ncbi:HAD-IIA family hydrolase [Actinotalea ferrariae]|uniref:HAD-IIA family hydrolase n=1 Tax=Actinotalea ferrariae TaxID=1386098 RepID=UPI001C8B548E|nr:HAD-IIA family hydrolase [Actinotalea ferrariae]MBX9245286.1 HAD-IIA family hydrolase [Actinotalea ferrariae]
MLQSCESTLATAFDVALVDLDGVAYRGPEPIPFAAESLGDARAAGMGLVFVTNNASREPETVAEHLTTLGIPTGPDEVMTAAQAAAAVLAGRLQPGARVLVVGGAGLVTAVRGAGFEVVSSADDEPVAVVQGFAPEVGWTQLAEAAYAVQRGAWYVVSNLDRTLPNERGIAPGNGSLVGVVRAATGVEPVSAGKPEPTMFTLAAQRRGAARPLVVGDRLDTDLGGARAAGMPGLHVLTGVSSARDAVLAVPGERPAFLGADLRSLHVSHAAPVPEDGWWACGGAAATVRDGRLELRDDATGDPLDVARAACAAVWSAQDDGRAVDPATVPELAPMG